MFCTRTSNNRINKIHKRALQIIHNDLDSTFDDLIMLSGDLTIHHKNIQKLMIEVYKIKNDIAPPILKDFFQFRENTYNLRNFQFIKNDNIRTVRYGQETIAYRAPQLWSLLPDRLKLSHNLISFVSNIKTWKPESCPCKICQEFIRNIGYI